MIGLLVNTTEKIKGFMGWCPKNDVELAYFRPLDSVMNTNTAYAEYEMPERKRIKMLADTSRDAGIISIFFPATVVAFLLMIILALIKNEYTVLSSIPISINYFAIILIYLQNNTAFELTPDNIIIHRPVLKSITMPKNSIIKKEVIKNFNYRLRWILLPIGFIIMLFIIRHNMIAIYLNTIGSAPLIVKIIDVYSIPLASVYLAVMIYHYLVRSFDPAFLKLTTKDREFTFYTKNPEELARELGVK